MKKTLTILQLNPPAEYTRLVKAAESFYRSIGSATLCRTCNAEWKKGCCGGCECLGSTGNCLQKSVYCAVWACSDLRLLIPSTLRERYFALMRQTTNVIGPGFRMQGFAQDLKDFSTPRRRTALASLAEQFEKLAEEAGKLKSS